MGSNNMKEGRMMVPIMDMRMDIPMDMKREIMRDMGRDTDRVYFMESS